MKFKDVAHYYLNTGLQLKCDSIFRPNNRELPKIKGSDATMTADLYADIINGTFDSVGHFTPILYSLDHLTKPIVHDGEEFVPFKKIAIYKSIDNLTENIQLGFVEFIVMKQLLSWHFNCFGLPKDQYIDKSTI